jgi:hypothetical protein
MFNDTFYPTPRFVVDKMLKPYIYSCGWGNDFYNKRILDPSAGKGDILDAIREKVPGGILLACEINADLRAILKEKRYPILADDFLTYFPESYFDYIFMNPPFANAEQHIMHAWNNCLRVGRLVSLIDASALEGKNAREQLLLKLIEDNGGRVERIGNAFSTAERPTRVEVAIIHLEKKDQVSFGINFEPKNEYDSGYTSASSGAELDIDGFVESLLSHYNASKGALVNYLNERDKIQRYVAPFVSSSKDNPLTEAERAETPQGKYNIFVSMMTNNAWDVLLEYPKLHEVLTIRARQMIDDFRRTQRQLDFNPYNIRMMMNELLGMTEDLLNECIVDAFDELTRYYKDNRVHVEGWAHDKAWYVNKKVVLPHAVEHDICSYHVLRLRYNAKARLEDLDRALCVLRKRKLSDIVTVVEACDACSQRRMFPLSSGMEIESTHFKIRCYNKGTIHLTFRDPELLKDFNVAAARGKKWLGDGK